MNKNTPSFFAIILTLLILFFCGIGVRDTVAPYVFPPETQELFWEEPKIKPPDISVTESAESIDGVSAADIGELCVFKLNNPATRADWTIVPPATCYIDSSGSSLAFASNVPAKYTIIAAIVEDGKAKILTHVCDYGTPPPNPSPPSTLKDWVTKNSPQDGKEQAAALAECYESAANAIENGTVRSSDAAFALLRSAAQAKIKTEVWQTFLDELSQKIVKENPDLKTLGELFAEIAKGLKTVNSE